MPCRIWHICCQQTRAEGGARNAGPLVAYKRVLDEVVEVTGLYCNFVTDMLATLMSEAFTGKLSYKPLTITNAPPLQAEQVHFFLRPPLNLDEMQTHRSASRRGRAHVSRKTAWEASSRVVLWTNCADAKHDAL